MKKIELPGKVAQNNLVELYGPLRVELLSSGRKVRLTEDYKVRTTVWPHSQVLVPLGFETDFASVPRVLWSVLPPWGRYSPAAVVHDWLYFNRQNIFAKRKCADKVFYWLMKKFRVPWWKRRVMYLGVRIGGGAAWRRYGK